MHFIILMPGSTTPLWAHRLEQFLRSKRGIISDYSLRKYRREIRRILEMLDEANLSSDPKKIGEREIAYLMQQWKKERLNPNYIIWRLNHLNLILRYYNNNVLQRMRMHLRPQERVHVRWLSDREIEIIRKTAERMGPQYSIRVHLGLDLLLRKIEMYRLNITDFVKERGRHGRIYVLGKGRYGGKPSMIPFHPYTEYYLEDYIKWRKEMIFKAKECGEPIRDPSAFLVWYRPGMGVGREGYTTMDNRLVSIMKEMNKDLPEEEWVRFSYHDLRRTGARLYWEQGWNLVEIQHLLRHEKIETTITYLGLKFDIVENALWAQGERRPRTSSSPKAGNPDVSVIPI